jgi:hypothetical protein
MKVNFKFKDSELVVKTEWPFDSIPKRGEYVKLKKFIKKDDDHSNILVKKRVAPGKYEDRPFSIASESKFKEYKDSEFDLYRSIIPDMNNKDDLEATFKVIGDLQYDLDEENNPEYVCFLKKEESENNNQNKSQL